MNRMGFNPFGPIQPPELDQDRDAHQFSTQLLDHFHACFQGAAGSDEVVDAVHGLVVEGPPPVAESLVAQGFLSAQREDAQGRGIFAPGERILLALKVEDRSPLMFLTDTRTLIQWDNPLLRPSRSLDRSRTISFPSGEKTVFFVFGRTPTLNADAAPGAEIEFNVEVEKDGVSVWRDTFAIVVAGAPTAVADFAALPEDFALGYSFPNPFNAATTIRYHLPHEALVDLSVFNAAGQPVRQLVDKTKAAGTHRAVWAGRDDGGHALATGVYFYRLVAGPFQQTRRMVLLK